MAEEILSPDTRPIKIKYEKLSASIRKMADDFIPRYRWNREILNQQLKNGGGGFNYHIQDLYW